MATTTPQHTTPPTPSPPLLWPTHHTTHTQLTTPPPPTTHHPQPHPPQILTNVEIQHRILENMPALKALSGFSEVHGRRLSDAEVGGRVRMWVGGWVAGCINIGQAGISQRLGRAREGVLPPFGLKWVESLNVLWPPALALPVFYRRRPVSSRASRHCRRRLRPAWRA